MTESSARTYLAMTANHWGRGESPVEAIYATNAAHYGIPKFTVWLMPEGAVNVHVNAMGAMCWTGSDSEPETVDLTSLPVQEAICERLSSALYAAQEAAGLAGLHLLADAIDDLDDGHRAWRLYREGLEARQEDDGDGE